MALQFILAGAQLAMGGAKAFMGHQQQQAQYRQAKSAAQRQRNLNLRQNLTQRQQLMSNYKNTIDDLMADQQAIADQFGARVNKGMRDIAFIDDFAADTYRLRQDRLNRTFAAMAFSDQANAVKLAQSQGTAAASGQSGVTAARRDFIAPLAQAGFNRAIQARQVTGIIDDFDMQSKIDNKRFSHQKRSIGDSVAVLPRFGRIPDAPIMPTMPTVQTPQNPGSMGLYMGLAQAGLSAATTFAQFSPQGPKLDQE